MIKFILESKKSVAEAATDLEAAVKRNGFGVLHVYDLKATLHSKGVELPQECRILEVCNPAQAAKVLASDMTLNLALPCRVSVYEDAGVTRIGMIRPSSLLGLLSEDPSLAATAEEVESAIERMIKEAA
jgi:uncharacterized protein (DUF302 family)